MACETPAKRDKGKETGNDGYFLVVGTDTIGKEDDIGEVLMKGFFETMNATGEIPRSIFFLNAGVRLTTLNEEVFPVLREMEKKGVEIFSCGTCLKHYGLEDSLKVGYRGSTDILVGNIADQRVVWI
jgi:selenium metabolism protein YedF